MTGFFAFWFLTFLLGAIFAKVLEDTLAANAIADGISRLIGPKRAYYQWLQHAQIAASEERVISQYNKDLPNIIVAIIPLVSVVVVLNVLTKFISTDNVVLIALFSGIGLRRVLMCRNTMGTHLKALTKGTENAIMAIANTCAVVGFGAVSSESTSIY